MESNIIMRMVNNSLQRCMMSCNSTKKVTQTYNNFDFLQSQPEMKDILSKILPTPPNVVFHRPLKLHNVILHPYATPYVP